MTFSKVLWYVDVNGTLLDARRTSSLSPSVDELSLRLRSLSLTVVTDPDLQQVRLHGVSEKIASLTLFLYSSVKIEPTLTVFTARCYASAVLAMGLCPSVRHKSEFY